MGAVKMTVAIFSAIGQSNYSYHTVFIIVRVISGTFCLKHVMEVTLGGTKG
jgi:hypothetical protein